jgi:hypothetical protein
VAHLLDCAHRDIARRNLCGYVHPGLRGKKDRRAITSWSARVDHRSPLLDLAGSRPQRLARSVGGPCISVSPCVRGELHCRLFTDFKLRPAFPNPSPLMLWTAKGWNMDIVQFSAPVPRGACMNAGCCEKTPWLYPAVLGTCRDRGIVGPHRAADDSTPASFFAACSRWRRVPLRRRHAGQAIAAVSFHGKP